MQSINPYRSPQSQESSVRLAWGWSARQLGLIGAIAVFGPLVLILVVLRTLQAATVWVAQGSPEFLHGEAQLLHLGGVAEWGDFLTAGPVQALGVGAMILGIGLLLEAGARLRRARQAAH